MRGWCECESTGDEEAEAVLLLGGSRSRVTSERGTARFASTCFVSEHIIVIVNHKIQRKERQYNEAGSQVLISTRFDINNYVHIYVIVTLRESIVCCSCKALSTKDVCSKVMNPKPRDRRDTGSFITTASCTAPYTSKYCRSFSVSDCR